MSARPQRAQVGGSGGSGATSGSTPGVPAGGGMRALLCLVLLLGTAKAQDLAPNPGFRGVSGQPVGWTLAGPTGSGTWEEKKGGAEGGGVLVVRGTGEDDAVWLSEPIPLKPGRLYGIRCVASKGANAAGGSAVIGVVGVNRDFRLQTTAETNEFYFIAPDLPGGPRIRLGQWHVNGELRFDSVSVVPAQALHRRFEGGLTLGEGERIAAGHYLFRGRFDGPGANNHRPLLLNRCAFNSNRWTVEGGSEIIYEHDTAGLSQTGASLEVRFNYDAGGVLRLEAQSRDSTAWVNMGEFKPGPSPAKVVLPASLFPCTKVRIRLSGAGKPGGLQFDQYDYDATVSGNPPDAFGSTLFLRQTQSDAAVETQLVVGAGAENSATRSSGLGLGLAITNRTGSLLALSVALAPDGEPSPSPDAKIRLESGASAVVPLDLGDLGPGIHALAVSVKGPGRKLLARTEFSLRNGLLDDARYGYRIPNESGLGLWWCENGWKVGRTRPLPAAPTQVPPKPLTVTLAKGEFEPVQLVLRPDADTRLEEVRVLPLRNPVRQSPPISVRVDEVAYVRVTVPTDPTCAEGDYPDPLPPLQTPMILKAERNQPIWLTVHAARETEAGTYRGAVLVRTSKEKVRVPFVVHVMDFELPKQPRLRSALGLESASIAEQHRIRKPEERRAVYERYLENFQQHRISPYSFFEFSQMKVTFPGQGTNQHAEVDFSAFDAAATRWLGPEGFTAFQLPLVGMGGGTFYSRQLGELAGYKEGTPEHFRLFADYLGKIQEHLQAKGWLSKAFTYWFDEPDPKDYAFVSDGMKRLKAAAPGIKRLLTEQPEPELRGNVDIWCALTPEWTKEKVQACTKAGEEVWWYICTGPKAPYVTEFIDHPGTELRLWPWQSWQYGVKGLLIWSTVYWHSGAAYPNALQDPWADPMSWVSGYGYKPGQKEPWGNGDGRFLYPPRRASSSGNNPELGEPVNSIRWENLRDGLDDYDYLSLLQDEIARSEAGKTSAAVLAKAKALLEVPPDISHDLTHFTADPRPIMAHREAVGRMIERLRHSKANALKDGTGTGTGAAAARPPEDAVARP